MPTEVLERILYFAIPDPTQIEMAGAVSAWAGPYSRKPLPLAWDPEWVKELRLVSKQIKKIVDPELLESMVFSGLWWSGFEEAALPLGRMKLHMLRCLKGQIGWDK